MKLKSCERIRTALDNLEPEKDVENFVNEYGTGNSIALPPDFSPSNGLEPQLPGSPIIRTADHQRVSRRPAPVYHSEAATLGQRDRQESVGDSSMYTQSTDQTNGELSYDDGSSYNTRNQASPPQTSPPNQPIPPVPEPTHHAPVSISTRTTPSPATNPRNNRESQPLPVLPPGGSSWAPDRSQTPPPPLPVQTGNRILFYGMISLLFPVGHNILTQLFYFITILSQSIV